MGRWLKILILLPLLFCVAACTWWQVASTTYDIVGMVPPDSFLEEAIEEEIEAYFDMEEGSLDLSPFSPESKT